MVKKQNAPEQQPDNTQWDEQSIEFIHFENINDTLEGELIDKTELTIRENPVGKFTVKRADGQRVAFLGGVQLDPLLADIDIGTKIKLQYIGREKTTGGNEVKQFKLWKAKTK